MILGIDGVSLLRCMSKKIADELRAIAHVFLMLPSALVNRIPRIDCQTRNRHKKVHQAYPAHSTSQRNSPGRCLSGLRATSFSTKNSVPFVAFGLGQPGR